MNTAEVIYKGMLRTECMHMQSGTVILTDAPTDNFGKGEAFSPTDLLATSLATCIITTIAIVTSNENIALDETKIAVKKIMENNPRRIAQIVVDIQVNNDTLSQVQKNRIEEIAHSCPVALSLHPNLIQKISFNYS